MVTEPFQVQVQNYPGYTYAPRRSVFAASQDGTALVTFDVARIRETLGWHEPVHTPEGVSFEFWQPGSYRGGDRVWVSVETRVGNELSAWTWQLTPESWTRILAAYEVAKATGWGARWPRVMGTEGGEERG